MSRWMIEKQGTGIERSGTGIERSGTGIERSGTGIERSGTGIERSGTGIERSGTGIQRMMIAICLATFSFSGGIQAGDLEPVGSLQLVVQNDAVVASWIIGESVFSGVSNLNGTFASLALTEIALSEKASGVQVAGTGSGVQVAGTGSGVQVAGTGSGVQVAKKSSNLPEGNIETASGFDPITITLPEGTGMAMEISITCGYASVTVVDSNSIEVVAFDNVRVLGISDSCSDGFGTAFRMEPGADFRAD